MKLQIRLLLFISLFASIPFASWATHLRAGEITAQLIDCSSKRYRIKLVLYTDLGSAVKPGGGDIDYGDGSKPFSFQARPPDEFQDLGDLVGYNVFYTEHTFPGPGTFTIRYMEHNRNGGVANMDNSVNTPFYIETKIVIDPSFGCNNTPILLNPPLDRACVGRAFFHNPGAYDPDGDSLSYEIVVNKQDVDLPVANYNFPNIYDIQTVPGAHQEDNDKLPPSYTLDQVTGNLTWDAPAQEGEYNIAFLIKEWRYIPFEGKYEPMGYVTRDMQIIVMSCDNERPELQVPNDTCVQAGKDAHLKAVITATDPDNDPITISAFGGPFEKAPFATYTPLPDDPINPQNPPAVINFDWNTTCNHVQRRPYQITFKAKDDPPKDKGASLTDFKSWFITVVAPPPTGLTAEYLSGKKVRLNWDPYECSSNAITMQVWRRVDSYPLTPDVCETGMPANAGYELIGNIDINKTEFIDNNSGNGLAYGATYCYRLVAQFPLPAGGESYVSDEACVTIDQDEKRFGPVITKVSITNTDVTDGTVDLQWYSPFLADQSAFPPPYTYKLFRGSVKNNRVQVIKTFDVSDTTFTDTGLNTEDSTYNYRLIAFDNSGAIVDTSAWASTVRLNTHPNVSQIALSWDANVPWSNNIQEFPYHYIYRNRVLENDPDVLVLIDSSNVNINGFNYLDSGQINHIKLDQNLSYCYYVTTFGSYGNPKLIEPLINNSQVICSQPNDTIPPCKIEAGDISINKDIDCSTFVSDKPCNFDSYFHILNWTTNEEDPCQSDVKSFEIWFSPTGKDEDFKLLTTVNDNTYTHTGLTSFAGCYEIRAIDRSGNKGEFSDKICYENCPHYELPNVFTPNNDGHNDEFQAFSFPLSKCPRFVKSVDFKVYDRWGNEVFHSGKDNENSIYINWDGKNNDGAAVDAGVYYYIADVQYDNISDAKQHQQIKGWIQVLR